MAVGADLPSLTPEEVERYGRHLVLPEVGLRGQRRLKGASVAIVGLGGLGCPLALYLAAAGVGRLGLVDDDRVDPTNLQRQVLYGPEDVGRRKVEVAAARLRALNPHGEVIPHPVALRAANALELLRPYDVVADGTDNFAARYVVNDACGLLGKPNVFGSIFRFEGQVAVFWAGRGPCYRCLFPAPPPPGLVPNCAEAGVFGVLPGIVGALQAVECLKLLLEAGEPLVGRLLQYDALAGRWHTFRIPRDPACPLCGDHPTLKAPVDYEAECGRATEAEGVAPAELAARCRASSPPLLLDVRTAPEWSRGHLPGARWIPLAELKARCEELPRDREIVVYCHLGPRSVRAVRLLREHGFRRVHYLRGGILAWELAAAGLTPPGGRPRG